MPLTLVETLLAFPPAMRVIPSVEIDIPANIEKSKTWAFVHDMHAEQRKGGPGVHPRKFSQNYIANGPISYSWALFVNKGGPGVQPWKLKKK